MLLVTAAGFVADVAKDMVIAGSFGATALADAFFLSYTIPFAIIASLLSAGRSVFVPIFTGLLLQGGRGAVWSLARSLILLGTAALLLVSLLGVAVSPWLVRLIGVGLSSKAEAIASQMSQVMFRALVPAATVAVLGSVLLSLRRFAVSSALNLVRASGMLVLLALLSRRLGIQAAALGLLAGVLGQLLLVAYPSWRLGFSLMRRPQLVHVHVRHAIALLAWPLLSGLLLQNSRVIERGLATLLASGSASAISYAYRIVFSVTTLLASSVVWVLLPTMSAHAAAGENRLLAERTSVGIKMMSLVIAPISIALLVCNRPIVQILFERGAFDPSATALTAPALQWYALGMLGISLLPVYNSAFYALGRVRVPVSNDVVLVLANVALDVVLVRTLGLSGLALGYSLAGILALGRIAILFRRHVGDATGHGLLVFGVRLAAASILMACCVAFVYGVVSKSLLPASWLGQLLLLGLTLALGVCVFYGSLMALRMPELSTVLSTIRELLHRSGRRQG